MLTFSKSSIDITPSPPSIGRSFVFSSPPWIAGSSSYPSPPFDWPLFRLLLSPMDCRFQLLSLSPLRLPDPESPPLLHRCKVQSSLPLLRRSSAPASSPLPHRLNLFRRSSLSPPFRLQRSITIWKRSVLSGGGSVPAPKDLESLDTDAIGHMYSPDLKSGWGIHVVQEVELLAKKDDRENLDSAIEELMQIGMQRETAAESMYKERCLPVNDGPSWAKYMSISGSSEDEYDIITLLYTEEGLLSVDENRRGHAAAFGDDIAIECLAIEFKREIYVVQAHGSDGMVEEENCVFFLPHRPRSEISEYPMLLLMKGTGWCGAGADHYEPLISRNS